MNPDSLQAFVSWLNSLHPQVKCTYEGNTSDVNFLDTTVYKRTLAIRPYVKITDVNTYLHFSSHHTRHLKTNIPHGQFLRIKCNTRASQDNHSSVDRSYQQFLDRGNPRGIVQDAVGRVVIRDRDSLFQDKHEDNRTHLHADWSSGRNSSQTLAFSQGYLGMRNIPAY